MADYIWLLLIVWVMFFILGYRYKTFALKAFGGIFSLFFAFTVWAETTWYFGLIFLMFSVYQMFSGVATLWESEKS